MKEVVNLWLSKNARLPGVLACAVRYQDQTSFTQSWSSPFKPEALENACRCLADTFQVLQLNRFTGSRVRWVYENALIFATRRADGTCLGIFTSNDPLAFDRADIERLLGEFGALGA